MPQYPPFPLYKSRLVLTIDTDLPIGTMNDILGGNPSAAQKHTFMQKLINFFRALNSGARSGNVYAGVVDSGSTDAQPAFVAGQFYGSPLANDTVTINNVVLTFVASPTPTNNQVSLSGSPSNATLASRLAAAINSSTTDALAGVVDATSSGATVIVTALMAGVFGNSITVSESATNFSWAAEATSLSGGLGRFPVLSSYPFYRNATYSSNTNPPFGPAAVNLASAAPFAILTKSGITDVPTSAITGNVGTSPITGAAITGLTQAEVTGIIYTVDGAGPAGNVTNPTLLTAAVSDMQAAYVDAAGRPTPDFTNLNGGALGGLSLNPGLYKFTTAVGIATNLTLNGGPNDTYIFQISGALTIASATSVLLAGGLQSHNIFWQVASGATLGTTSSFQGNILSLTTTIMDTGAVINGRLLAQTAATLDHNTVTLPS